MSRNPVPTAALCLILALIAVGCDSTSEPKVGPPAALVVVSGNAQTGPVAAALSTPIVVRVNDANGTPVPNTPITWSTANGGTVVSAPMTDASGTAQATWTLGTTTGVQTATATVAGITPANITATATAGAASQLQKTTGDAQSGTVGTALTARPSVRVQDRFGNNVANASVTWSVAAGGGAVSPAVSTTDASGVASTTWTLGTVSGANRLSASVSGVTPTEFTATGQAGPVASIAITPGSGTVDWGATLQLSARASDSFGNAVTRPVSWSSSNSAVATVNATGLVTGVRAGLATISAAADGRSGTADLNVTANSTRLVFRNQLVLAANVTVNGALIGSVNANSTREFSVPVPPQLVVEWRVIRVRTNAGVEVGDQMAGIYSTITSVAPTHSFTIDNVLATTSFFAPIMDNRSSTNWLMGVNMGTANENRCFCVVSAGNINVLLGYYRLLSNTNVRAFRDGSNYSGSFVFWDNFTPLLQAGSGAISLTSNLNPSDVPQLGNARRWFQQLPFTHLVPHVLEDRTVNR